MEEDYCKETTDRWTYRQTAMVKPVYLHDFVGGVYKLILNVEKSLKNDPPGGQIFVGESLFHDLWFKI